MPYNPDVALNVNPVAPPPSPLTTLGSLMQLRGQAVENALRQQQLQTAQAQQADVQAQADQRNRDLADQNTVQQKLQDPDFARAVASWDGNSAFPLDGVVQPKTADAIKTNVQAMQKAKLAMDKDQLADFEARHKQIQTSLQGLMFNGDGTPRADADIAALAPGMIQQLIKDKMLKPENVPQQPIRGFDDATHYATVNSFESGLNDYALASKKNSADVAKDQAQTDQYSADAAKAVQERQNLVAGLPKIQADAALAHYNQQFAAAHGGLTPEQIEQQRHNRSTESVQQSELNLKRKTFDATFGSGLDANGHPLTGDELKAAAEADPAAKAIAEYRMVPPPPTLRGGQENPIYRKVMAINPNFDASTFPARNATAKDFSPAGASGKAITAADTALAHLDSISKAGAALQNGDVQQLNRLANFVGAQVGATPKQTYDTIVSMVAPEVSKAVIGEAGGEHERQSMQQNFSSNMSPEQREQAIGHAVGLLSARVQKQAHAYESQMGRPLDRQLSPESQSVMQRYSGGGAKTYSVTATGPNGHKIGTNDNGKTWFDVQTGAAIR